MTANAEWKWVFQKCWKNVTRDYVKLNHSTSIMEWPHPPKQHPRPPPSPHRQLVLAVLTAWSTARWPAPPATCLWSVCQCMGQHSDCCAVTECHVTECHCHVTKHHHHVTSNYQPSHTSPLLTTPHTPHSSSSRHCMKHLPSLFLF